MIHRVQPKVPTPECLAVRVMSPEDIPDVIHILSVYLEQDMEAHTVTTSINQSTESPYALLWLEICVDLILEARIHWGHWLVVRPGLELSSLTEDEFREKYEVI